MKKIRTTTLVALAALTAACTHKPVQPRFETLTVDTLLDRGTPCNIEWRFASIANAAESPALKAIEEANINYFFELEAFIGSPREAADAALGQIVGELLPDTPAAHGYDISADSEADVADTLLTYVITRSTYTGGAHGMYGTECHTYSIPGGYELSLADFFDLGQLDALDRAIRETLRARYGVRTDDELTEHGFFVESIAVTENFRIAPDSITFYYNPYEIGCYALGAVEVTVGRSGTDGPESRTGK